MASANGTLKTLTLQNNRLGRYLEYVEGMRDIL